MFLSLHSQTRKIPSGAEVLNGVAEILVGK